jgi:hypothetical protein
MNQVFLKFQQLGDSKKLMIILAVALIIRLIAAIYSAGYAMHDDHFLVVETPSSWAYGFDSGSWLQETQQREIVEGKRDELLPQGHSLFYPGLQFCFFSLMKFLGVENPKTMMLVNRILHAFLGVFVVYLTYVLSSLLSTPSNACSIAWIAALGWAWPFLSVRNLVEVVSVPVLLLAVILTLKGMRKDGLKLGLTAGIIMALAVSTRYQTVVFFGVLGLIVLFKRLWYMGLSMLLGFVLCFFLVQGLPDWILWGAPFAEIKQYFSYNMSDVRYEYAEATGGRSFGLKYIVVLSFLTVPFLGAFWLFGFFRQWRKMYILFWPCIAFLLVHMSYVNAQERFIFPIIHVVLILGFLGWKDFFDQSKFWQRNINIWRGINKFSLSLNFVLLLLLSTYYGKKARVESVYALYQNESVDFVIHENTYDGYTPMLPWFYSKKWDMTSIPVTHPEQYASILNAHKGFKSWIYFQGDDSLEQRIATAREHFPEMRLVKRFEASFLDNVIKVLNPVNRNEAITVYEVEIAHQKDNLNSNP